MKQITSLFLLLAVVMIDAKGDELYLKKQLIEGQDTLNYRILYPKNYDTEASYPLVVFLHGAGERGADNERQLTHGSQLFLNEKNRDAFPAIVIFPQCPVGQMWTPRNKVQDKGERWHYEFPFTKAPTVPSRMVNTLVENLIKSKAVDEQQLYVMGLSMGGVGTLELLYRWPEKYAAAICICGAHNPTLVEAYKSIPIWFAHGGQDDVTPCYYSMAVYSELYKNEGNKRTKYTLFEEANHNSWDATLALPDLLEWLFSMTKDQ